MKIKNLVLIIFAGMLFLNLVSAYSYTSFVSNHNQLNTKDNVIFVIKYADTYNPDESWNSERYSTYDYRNGYSYRTSQEYSTVRKRVDQTNNNFKRTNRNSEENTFYIYNEHMRSYEEHSCYNQAPSDKLFYIKCK